jgi:hypothetical protein
MESTAIYPNRIEDKTEVESKLKFNEFGDSATKFYIKGNLFAVGYQRIVYGDHGPYVEFSKENICCFLKPKYDLQIPEKLPDEKKTKYFYFWLRPIFNSKVKVYLQIKPVTYLKNAPPRDDGKPSRFNRSEGYADYKRGFYYVSPFEFEANTTI